MGEDSTAQRDYTLQWYYDTKDSRCRQFYYLGAGGNANNFNSESACLASCEQQSNIQMNETETETTKRPSLSPVQQAAEKPRGNQDLCRLQPDAGDCRVAEARFYYNSEEGTCLLFTYGGCGGNDNNFMNVEDCQNSCGNSQDTCSLPSVRGTCDQNQTKWYYEAHNERCTTFVYSGCEGNTNNFDSREECEHRCQPTKPSYNTDSPIDLSNVSKKTVVNVNIFK